jgi:hypothetical protein
LLANAGLILEPDFDRLASMLRRDRGACPFGEVS